MDDLDDSLVGVPFGWYSGIFLRLTLAISRRQELIADMVARLDQGELPYAKPLRPTDKKPQPAARKR